MATELAELASPELSPAKAPKRARRSKAPVAAAPHPTLMATLSHVGGGRSLFQFAGSNVDGALGPISTATISAFTEPQRGDRRIATVADLAGGDWTALIAAGALRELEGHLATSARHLLAGQVAQVVISLSATRAMTGADLETAPESIARARDDQSKLLLPVPAGVPLQLGGGISGVFAVAGRPGPGQAMRIHSLHAALESAAQVQASLIRSGAVGVIHFPVRTSVTNLVARVLNRQFVPEPSVRLVRQVDGFGCGVAALAMACGIEYEAARHAFQQLGLSKQSGRAAYASTVDNVLGAVAYSGCHGTAAKWTSWDDFAGVGIVMVIPGGRRGRYTHWVVAEEHPAYGIVVHDPGTDRPSALYPPAGGAYAPLSSQHPTESWIRVRRTRTGP